MIAARKKSLKIFCFGVVTFLLVFATSFVGIQFFTKTGIFKVPGVVFYDESLNEDEVAKLGVIFNNDLVLDYDLKIHARTEQQKPKLAENEFLISIMAPVADFYDARTDTSEYTEGEFRFISVDDLDFKVKLLSMDGEYFLETFETGAEFRTITFESEGFDTEIRPLVADVFTMSFPEKSDVLSLAQTGVTALSRRMNAKLNSVGDASYFAKGIGEYLSKFDLTHTSNEASFSRYASSSNICSDVRFFEVLTLVGVDIVELTGNHNIDCGDTDAIKTIELYQENNMSIVGGGRSASEAAIPLQIDDKGNSITFLAYNLSTGGATYDNTPGANQYYEEDAVARIKEAKERGDRVIVDIQYYECNAYASTYEDPICDRANSSAGDQIGLFRHLIDLGADVVVGTSAHQPQTFELYGDGEIYYGLGNLFFDQSWWPGTTRSLILEHYFYNNRLLQTRITPTVYDSNLVTTLMDKDTTKWFIERLTRSRP